MDTKTWDQLASHLKTKAGWKCQACGILHGVLYADGKKAFLTVAHLDQQKNNNQISNLKVLCYRCHFTFDRPFNVRKRKYGKGFQNPSQLKLWKD